MEREKLSRQLEEALKIRMTEPEEAIEHLTASYEARLDGKHKNKFVYFDNSSPSQLRKN